MLKHSQSVLALWQDFLAQLNAWLIGPQLKPIPISSKKSQHNIVESLQRDNTEYQKDYSDRY